MDNLIISTVVGSLAGVIGTGLGGVIAYFLNNPSKRWLSTLLSISAGLMLGVVCFDLLPRSFELGSFGVGLIGTIIGVIIMALLQEILSRRGEKRAGKLLEKHIDKRVVRSSSKSLSQTGILIGIGIALHNFPEGLAIGVGFTSFQSFGLGLSLIIALHDIPEGIAMAVPMRMGGTQPGRVVLAALLAGVPTGIGALIGNVLGEISIGFIGVCLGFAGGAMLYITCSELIPESRDLYKGRISGVGLMFGILLGIILSKTI